MYVHHTYVHRMIHCTRLHRLASLRRRRHLMEREGEEEARVSDD